MNKVMIVHKGNNLYGNEINDLQINITDLNNGNDEVYKIEGVNIAIELCRALPPTTIKAIMIQLTEIEARW